MDHAKKIYICVGSSCHLKGSYHIIHLMKEQLEANGLADQIELKASFCLGKCTSGVTIKVDDKIICGVCAENFLEIYDRYVLKKTARSSASQKAKEVKQCQNI